jgi:hypothetical protein
VVGRKIEPLKLGSHLCFVVYTMVFKYYTINRAQYEVIQFKSEDVSDLRAFVASHKVACTAIDPFRHH